MVTSLTNKRTISLVLSILFLQVKHSDGRKSSHAVKRSLLTFPPNSLLQLNMGVTLSGDFERNNAAIALAFQQLIPLPEEAQPLLVPSVVEKGRKFSIYHHLRDVISSYGFNGSDCLRKMVCQIGESPLVGGLLEDVVTLVLTPSRHRSMPVNDTLGESLLESEKFGAKGGNCTSAYPQCVRTPLDFISTLIHL